MTTPKSTAPFTISPWLMGIGGLITVGGLFVGTLDAHLAVLTFVGPVVIGGIIVSRYRQQIFQAIQHWMRHPPTSTEPQEEQRPVHMLQAPPANNPAPIPSSASLVRSDVRATTAVLRQTVTHTVCTQPMPDSPPPQVPSASDGQRAGSRDGRLLQQLLGASASGTASNTISPPIRAVQHMDEEQTIHDDQLMTDDHDVEPHPEQVPSVPPPTPGTTARGESAIAHTAHQDHPLAGVPVTYYPEMSDQWWMTFFPHLGNETIHPIEIATAEGKRPCTPLDVLSRIHAFLPELREVRLGIDAKSARQPGTITIAFCLVPAVVAERKLQTLTRRLAGVSCLEYERGGYAVVLILAAPIETEDGSALTGERGRRRVAQITRHEEAMRVLPVAPHITSILDQIGREGWSRNGGRIPIGLWVTHDEPKPRLLCWDLAQKNHLGWFGISGCGKDAALTLFVYLATLLHSPHHLQVMVFDRKGSDYRFVEQLPHALCTVAMTDTMISTRMEQLSALVDFRSQVIGMALPYGTGTIEEFNRLAPPQREAAWRHVATQWQQTGGTPPPLPPDAFMSYLLVVITEANILTGAREAENVISKGRSAGVRMMVSGQRDVGLAKIRSQLSFAGSGYLRESDKEMAERLFGDGNADQGLYSPLRLPPVNKGNPATLGLFVVEHDDVLGLLRTFYADAADRERVFRRIHHLWGHPHTTRRSTTEHEIPPVAQIADAESVGATDILLHPKPFMGRGGDCDEEWSQERVTAAVQAWATALQKRNTRKELTQNQACGAVFGWNEDGKPKKNTTRMAMIRTAFAVLQLTRDSYTAEDNTVQDEVDE